MSEWVDVAKVEDFTPGTQRVLEVDDAAIAVFNLDGEFYAIEDVCTHDYASLTGAKIEDNQIICPRHGARFCIKTGAALTPPAYEPIATFPLRIDNGVVQVRDNRWD